MLSCAQHWCMHFQADYYSTDREYQIPTREPGNRGRDPTAEQQSWVLLTHLSLQEIMVFGGMEKK